MWNLSDFKPGYVITYNFEYIKWRYVNHLYLVGEREHRLEALVSGQPIVSILPE